MIINTNLSSLDFKNLSDQVFAFVDSLNGIRGYYGEGISSAQTISTSISDSFNSGGWNDDVSAQVFQYAQSLNSGVTAINTDINGGGLVSLITQVGNLGNTLYSCSLCKHDLELMKSDISSGRVPSQIKVDVGTPNERFVRNNDYYILVDRINKTESQLVGLVNECASIVSSISAVVFTGTTVEMGSGAGAQYVPVEGEAPETSKRDEIAANFDYDSYQDQMANLFQWGVFSTNIRYGDNSIQLKALPNDSNHFALFDLAGNQLTDQIFDKSSVLQQGDGTYSNEVADAAIDYFASLQ